MGNICTVYVDQMGTDQLQLDEMGIRLEGLLCDLFIFTREQIIVYKEILYL